MQPAFMVLADYANVSSDQKFNIIGVFDTLTAREFPVAHPQMFLAFALYASQKEKGQQVDIAVQLLHKRTSAVTLDLSFKVAVPQSPPDQNAKIQHCIALNGLTFQEPGYYEFQVKVGGAVVATTPLNVVRTATPAIAG